MSEIFNFSSIVHDGNGKCFKLAGNGSQFFRSVISDIIRERFPNIDLEGEDGPFVCSTYLPTTSIDVPQFIPVYMFIFKLLKKKKLDFKHVVFTAESFPELTEFFTTLSAELEIEKILTSVPSTLDEDDIERAVYNLEESKKHAEVKELLELPPIVVAYYNVYGHLPAN